MTLRVQVNEISRESFKSKDGTQRNVTRLVCVDKDNNAAQRFKGDLVVGVPADQLDFISENVRRDDMIEVELHGVRVFGTQWAFEGRVIPESVKGSSKTPSAAKAAA